MKKPFLYALVAAEYIVLLVLSVSTFGPAIPEPNIVIPIGMLSLLVLSVAVMAFLFFSEPVQLLIEKRPKEAMATFSKTVAFFICFALIFVCLLFVFNK